MELIIHGEVKKSIAWGAVDAALYSNEKAVQKVRNTLAALPLKGVVHIHFDEPMPKSKPELVGTDGIDFFIHRNDRQQHHLTPWIIIHRLHHSAVATMLPHYRKQIDLIVQCEDELQNTTADKQMLGLVQTDVCAESPFFTLACTMRSARNQNFRPLVADVLAELFAQYVFTGDITFKLAKDWQFSAPCRYSNQYSNQPSSVDRVGRNIKWYVHSTPLNEARLAQCDAAVTKLKPLLIQSFDEMIEQMKYHPNIY